MAGSGLAAEIQRKLFHSLMVLVAVVNWIGGPPLAIGFAGICLAFFLGFDFSRVRVYGYFPFRRVTDRVMRSSERTKLGANVFFAVGTMISLLLLYLLGIFLNLASLSFFQTEFICRWMLTGWLAVSAVIVSAIGDGAAAIVGMSIGRHQLRRNRTVEGSIGGFVFGFIAFLVLSYFIGIPWFYGIIAALMLVLVDVVAVSINDNLVNPVVLGIALAISEIIFTLIGVV
jgi:dolichol kinase